MTRLTALLTIVLGLASAPVAPGRAEPVLVELFTSQGCAACPPADALLGELAAREDVLPLALHVDYWDYIGWTDTFASPAFTKRQRAYAYAAGRTMVYTPQMIVAGRTEIAGHKPMHVVTAIEAALDRPSVVAVRLARRDGTLSIRLRRERAFDGVAKVALVRFRPRATVEVTAGENAGRVLEHTNVVSEWRELAEWSGDDPLALEVDYGGEHAAAVVVQAEGPGPVLAVARVP